MTPRKRKFEEILRHFRVEKTVKFQNLTSDVSMQPLCVLRYKFSQESSSCATTAALSLAQIIHVIGFVFSHLT